MIDIEVINGLKERYKYHPLIFQRSIENAESAGELFDILEEMPELPIMWDYDVRRWAHVKDMALKSEISKLQRN